jgi:hypothetical protein
MTAESKLEDWVKPIAPMTPSRTRRRARHYERLSDCADGLTGDGVVMRQMKASEFWRKKCTASNEAVLPRWGVTEKACVLEWRADKGGMAKIVLIKMQCTRLTPARCRVWRK